MSDELALTYEDHDASLFSFANVLLVDVGGTLSLAHIAALRAGMRNILEQQRGLVQAYFLGPDAAPADLPTRSELLHLWSDFATRTRCHAVLVDEEGPRSLLARATVRALSVRSGHAERFAFFTHEQALLEGIAEHLPAEVGLGRLSAAVVEVRRSTRRFRLYGARGSARPTQKPSTPANGKSARATASEPVSARAELIPCSQPRTSSEPTATCEADKLR